MFTWVLGQYVTSTVLSVPKSLEGADRVGGQLRGDKECPFSGVTNSGRVWRNVPESDVRSVGQCLIKAQTGVTVLDDDDDRFYMALFSALEQIHCARI